MNDQDKLNYLAQHPYGYVWHDGWFLVDTIKFLSAIAACSACLDGTKIKVYSEVPK
jgi:hypothetical protein